MRYKRKRIRPVIYTSDLSRFSLSLSVTVSFGVGPAESRSVGSGGALTRSSFEDLTGLTRAGRRSSKSESAGLLVAPSARGEELKSVMASPTGKLFVDNAGEELHGVTYADSRSLRAYC